MGRPNKLQRYADNSESPYILEPSKPLYNEIAGNWNKLFFQNDNPLTIELACGRGEYTIGLAEKIPDRNFIGIDLKGDRIWKGSRAAEKLELNNVCLVRSRIEMIPNIFSPAEVDEIWLTFPDPRPRDRDEKHRLTNIYYLNTYRSVLKQNGWFRFKTDNTPLFDYTLEVLSSMPTVDLEFTHDLYNSSLLNEHFGLKTKYEKIWTAKGERIKYLKCKFG